jgi:rhodanese-related sulfurtransferase
MKNMKLVNILIALLSTAVLFSCTSEVEKQYVLSPEETLEAYINKDDVLSPEKLANILLCEKDTNLYQFVDIRTPHEFAIKHLKGAINIPSKDILDESNMEVLNNKNKISILFCKGDYQAVNAYLMLKQLNYKNIRVALGGYDFIDRYIMESYGIKTGMYDGEKPRYDFLRLVTGMEQKVVDSIAKPTNYTQNPNKVVKDFDEECPDLN